MIRQLFFKGYDLTQFKALDIAEDKVKTRVYLTTKNGETDITSCHSVFCQEPLLAGIILNQEIDTPIKITIVSGEKIIAVLHGKITRRINLTESFFYLAEITRARFTLRSFLLRLFLYTTTISNISKNLFMTFAGLYAFPRKVVLVSFQSEEHFNIFPMDFQLFYPKEGLYFLGLRNTNITLRHIISDKKLVVSDFECPGKDIIYQLGKHHSGNTPSPDLLPFKTRLSDHYNIPIAEFSTSYHELEIINNIDLGSHTLLVGKVIHSEITAQIKKFHHIDTIAFISQASYYSPFLLR